MVDRTSLWATGNAPNQGLLINARFLKTFAALAASSPLFDLNCVVNSRRNEIIGIIGIGATPTLPMIFFTLSLFKVYLIKEQELSVEKNSDFLLPFHN